MKIPLYQTITLALLGLRHNAFAEHSADQELQDEISALQREVDSLTSMLNSTGGNTTAENTTDHDIFGGPFGATGNGTQAGVGTNSTGDNLGQNTTNVTESTAPSVTSTAAPSSLDSEDTVAPTESPTNADNTYIASSPGTEADDVKGMEEPTPKKSGTNPFVYVLVSGIIAFGIAKFIQLKRRKQLRKNRDIAMAGRSSSGHLNELNYDNDII